MSQSVSLKHKLAHAGLKGIASAFFADQARRKAESDGNDSYDTTFPLLDHSCPSLLEEDEALRNSFDVIIPTIGYRNAPLPRITVDDLVVDVHTSARDPQTSQLFLQSAATTSDSDIFRPGQSVELARVCKVPVLNDGMVHGLMGLGIGWPDYFEVRARMDGERTSSSLQAFIYISLPEDPDGAVL